MFAKGKQLAGQSSLYTIGEVLRGSLSFLLLPIYTRVLAPADYAILGVMNPIFAVLSAMMALGMPAALLRIFFDYQGDSAKLRRYVGTVAVFGVGCGFFGSLFLTILGPPLFGRLLPNTPFNPYVVITIWNAGFTVVSVLALQLFRARQQAAYFVTFSLVDFALTTALILLLMIGLRQGVLGSLWGQLLSAMIMAVPALLVMARAGTLGISWSLLRPSLRFGLPLLPFLLGTWALNVSDRIILDGLASRDALGLYTLGYQFGMLLYIIAIALNNAWQPFYYQNAAEAENGPAIGAFITYQAALIVWLSLAVALLAPEVIQIVAAPAYWSAAAIVPWIVAGYIARFLHGFSATGLLYSKRPGLLAGLTIAAAALNIGLNLLLVPRFGILAAAVNTLVGFFALFVVVYVVGQRVSPIPYEWGRLLRLLALASLLFATGWWLIPQDRLLLNIALDVVLLAALPALLWITGFFTPSERAQVMRIAGKYVSW